MIIGLGISVIWVSSSKAEQTVCKTIAYSKSEAYVPNYFDALRFVYKRAGECVDFIALPYDRATHMVRIGEIDGIFGRSSLSLKKTPDLHIVSEPLISLDVLLLGAPETVSKVSSYEDLRSLRIASFDGADWTRVLLGNQNSDLFHSSRSYQELCGLFDRGRIEGLLVHNLLYKHLLEEHSYLTEGFSVSQPIGQLEVFHVVSSNNRHLLGKLSESLNAYKGLEADKIHLANAVQKKH